MASPEPSISYALLTAQPSFDSNTITLYLQMTFSAGAYYQEGGINAGLKAFVSALSIDTNNFLFAEINDEAPISSSPLSGGYFYQYNPVQDTIQILQIGSSVANSPSNIATGILTEISPSYGIGAAILNSSLVLKVTYNRL